MQPDGLMFAGHSREPCMPADLFKSWARRSTPWPGGAVAKDAVHDYDEHLATNRYFDRQFRCGGVKICRADTLS